MQLLGLDGPSQMIESNMFGSTMASGYSSICDELGQIRWSREVTGKGV